MNPKEYYYKRFRKQFEEWVKKTKAHDHPGEGIYIPIQELRKENLDHVSQEDYMLFHCAIAGTVLIDQVMYTHFKEDYPAFKELTKYPKIEYGITGINVSPWDITHNAIGLTTLERFLEFFVKDLEAFFQEHKFKTATWKKVKSAMLSDAHCVSGPRGEILKRYLKGKTEVDQAQI